MHEIPSAAVEWSERSREAEDVTHNMDVGQVWKQADIL